jgi:hypothetical protein
MSMVPVSFTTEIHPYCGFMVATTMLALTTPAAGFKSNVPGMLHPRMPGPGKTVRNVS